ncbi:MAG: alpha/beta hydrolase [Alphaproteobacteria bacterium]
MAAPSGSLLDGPRVPPASGGPADRLVVLLHGYGADGNDLIGLAPHWQRLLPSAAFVSPHAPEPCAMSPMGGYQWFPITRLDPSEMWTGVQSAAPVLDAFLDAELARLNLTGDRLALVGFSQGTMMSLHVGLRRRAVPACIVGFSGALTGAEHLPGEIVSKPPVLLVHGDADQTVPLSAMHQAAQTLGQAGVPCVWHMSRGVGHGIAPDGLELGGRFLVDAFNGTLASGPAS